MHCAVASAGVKSTCIPTVALGCRHSVHNNVISHVTKHGVMMVFLPLVCSGGPQRFRTCS